MKKDQKIKCNVESCKHQNIEEECCKLNEIKVCCDCGCDDADCKSSTICNNFECDSNKLNKED